MYNKIDIDVLKEFIEGEVNDIYAFVKKVYYKDMYMTIHDFCFNDLKNDDSITFYQTQLKKSYDKYLKEDIKSQYSFMDIFNEISNTILSTYILCHFNATVNLFASYVYFEAFIRNNGFCFNNSYGTNARIDSL